MTAPVEPRLHTVLRLLFALALAGSVSAFGATSSGRVLHGPLSIVGYPIYADFDPNHYLVVFYFVSLVFPLGTLLLYLLASRFGPLRRPPRQHAERGAAPPLVGATAGDSPAVAAAAISALVGGLLGLELAVIVNASGSWPTLTALGGGALFALLALVLDRRKAKAPGALPAALQLFGVAIAVFGLFGVSEVTVATVNPGGSTVHYRFFPLWLALVAVALGALLVYRASRRGTAVDRTARNLVAFVAVPVLLFLVIAVIPGAGGKFDTFGEGEYLGGSYLLLHGALPWRDLYLIHGLLDDGFKPLLGFAVFGFTRWGAAAGLSFIWAPAYWVATYLFAVITFGRRWFAAAAAAGAVALGIFANWDVRYLFWPLLLALFAVTLRRGGWRFGAALGAAALLQALLVPEMLYAAAAVGATLVAFEFVERGQRRPRWKDFQRTSGATVASAIGAVAFGIWLAVVGGVSGFFGYFSDFASAHSLSGGIPLFTNYAIPSHPDALGIYHFITTAPGWFTRYSIELVLPVLAILATIALCSARWRSGRRLYLEDWVTIAAALLTLAYYPKGLSRADVGHIAESFSVAVPLLCCLAYRLVVALDALFLRLLERRGAAKGHRRLTSPAGLLLVGAVLAVAPTGPFSTLDAAPAHFRTTVPPPSGPVVAGAGAIGYDGGALPADLVQDLAAIIKTYAGPKRLVFDFTNAPGLFDFLLATSPASRFYDVNLTITDSAQQQAVRDIEAAKPRLVIWRGITGLPNWDFLENEVRDHIVSVYLLDHYRPLADVDGEVILIADSVTHPAPLPRLLEPPVTAKLYDSGRACAFGYAPDFLPSPSTSRAINVPVTEVPAPPHQGRVYRAILPASAGRYQYVVVTRSDSAGPGSFVLSNLRARSRRDITWAMLTTTSTAAVEAGACLQWHGFENTVFLRYKGPGTPTSLSVIP